MEPPQLIAANPAMQQDAMRITEEERQWALSIKQAANETDELQPLSDFGYVELAMLTRGNTQEALHRMGGLQAFRTEYGINNSPEQGVQCLERTMHLLPGFVLHLDNCPNTNDGILVWDASVCYPETILSISHEGGGADYNWRNYVVAMYYMYYSCQPTLVSIRDGLTLMMDCGQVSWANVSMDFERRMHEELRAFYPLKWKRIMAYNTAVIANIGWSLFKQFMSPHMRESLQLGCQVTGLDSDTRLRDIFLQPSLEGSRQNILERVRHLIALRNENAGNFAL